MLENPNLTYPIAQGAFALGIFSSGTDAYVQAALQVLPPIFNHDIVFSKTHTHYAYNIASSQPLKIMKALYSLPLPLHRVMLVDDDICKVGER